MDKATERMTALSSIIMGMFKPRHNYNKEAVIEQLMKMMAQKDAEADALLEACDMRGCEKAVAEHDLLSAMCNLARLQ